MDTQDYKNAHKYSINNKPMLTSNQACGCFFCKKIFPSTEIRTWLKDKTETALCPYCCIDSVIGENSGYHITPEFLDGMHDHWFGKDI